MDIEEYKAKLMEAIEWKLSKLEPELVQRILDESGPDCHNKIERITHSIFFWSGKDKDKRREVMDMFGIKAKGGREQLKQECLI